MKKELIISILIGFGLGLIITFGVWTFKKSMEAQNKIISPVSQEPASSPSPVKISQTLSLVSPLDQSISKEAKILISGVTSPLSSIIILSEKGEKAIQADAKGNFETEINLISGENEIEIHSFSDKGEEISKTITVVYSTAEI